MALGLCRSQRWLLTTWLLAAEAPVARRGIPLPLRGRYRHHRAYLNVHQDLLSSPSSASSICVFRETERPPRKFSKKEGAGHTLFTNRTCKSRRKRSCENNPVLFQAASTGGPKSKEKGDSKYVYQPDGCSTQQERKTTHNRGSMMFTFSGSSGLKSACSHRGLP